MKAKRIPPMSVRNGLKLKNIEDELRLTESEGALIAKNLLF